MDPVVITLNEPNALIPLPGPPKLGPKGTKILLGISTVIISLTILSFSLFTILVNNQKLRQSTGLALPVPTQTAGNHKSTASLPGGGIAVGTGGNTGTNSPVITLTSNPASVATGGTAKLSWSVTNNPTSCTASDDWSGAKATSGSETTPRLTIVQTYLFTLTCKNATGTGFATIGVGATDQGGTGSATRPMVSMAATPTSIYTGDSSTLSWSVANNPTSCTSSGNWSGAKSATGTASTGALTIAKTYTYTLSCSNSSGTGFATATVAAATPPPNLPIVSLSSNPVGPITPGTAVTLTWAVTNTPTSCTATGDWTGAKATGGGSQAMGALNTIKTYSYTISCGNGTGSTVDTAVIQVLPNPSVVSLSVSPGTIFAGSAATLTWSATNSPSSCTATGDWSGAKAASGSISTGTLNTARTYLYNLTCTNSGGTGFANNIALIVKIPAAPVVSLSANPISITAGGSSTLSWSATNSPTSCTASGDWVGAKSAGGTQNTGVLSTIKTYSYTLSCSNAGGSNAANTTVNVTSGAGGAIAPVVTISMSPANIGTGSSSTLSWSTTNNPTSCTASGSWSGAVAGSGSTNTGTMASSGTFTYTLACSNSAGSNTKSATLTVLAVPIITISVAPTSINTGSAATITWSASASPSSCVGSGSWTGSKAASGSVSTGTIASAGSYTYTLTCTNTGGSGANSATLTVSNPAPVYCGGSSPCYGPTNLAGHATVGNCWGWNLNRVINITGFRPKHPGGQQAGSLESAASSCNHDLHAILLGQAAISGYTDGNGNTTHNHTNGGSNNTASSILSYLVGYWDATKP